MNGETGSEGSARSVAARSGPPRALIVYGTSQGTTQKVAESIRDGMKAGGASASAIRLDYLRLMPGRVKTADVLGIGSPVYFLRPAGYLTRFVSGLGSLEGKRAFVFCTTGMDRVGETLYRLHALLSDKGALVVGAQQFRTAMSYFPYRRRGFGNPERLPDEQELAAAHGFGERMARAEELDPVRVEGPSWLTRLKARVLASRRFRRALFPRVRIVEPACTGYGSCLSRCLFDGIDREENEKIPFLNGRCEQCLECIAWCPRGAIAVDSRVKDWISTLSYRLGLH